MTHAKRWILRALAGAGLLAVVGVASLYYVLYVAPFRGTPFVPGQWSGVLSCEGLSSADCALHRASCPRGGMVNDVLSNLLRPGEIDRDEVMLLLGDYVPTRLPNQSSADCGIYPLGPCSGLGAGMDAIYVCFDPQNQLEAAGLSRS